jgi:hypothetical protein
VIVEVRTPADTEEEVGIRDLFSFDRITNSIQRFGDRMARARERETGSATQLRFRQRRRRAPAVSSAARRVSPSPATRRICAAPACAFHAKQKSGA